MFARWKYAVNARTSRVIVARSNVGQLVEPALLGVGADLLHEGEQVVALGARQGLAEDRRDAADVTAQLAGRGAVRRTPVVGLHASIVTDRCARACSRAHRPDVGRDLRPWSQYPKGV